MSSITKEQQEKLKQMPKRVRETHARAMRHTNHLWTYRPQSDKAMENFLATCGIKTPKALKEEESK